MPFVKFLESRTVKNAEGTTYEKDNVYELSQRSVDHWLRRSRRDGGPIVEVVDPPKKETSSRPKRSGPPKTKRVGDDGNEKKMEYDVPPPRGNSPEKPDDKSDA